MTRHLTTSHSIDWPEIAIVCALVTFLTLTWFALFSDAWLIVRILAGLIAYLIFIIPVAVWVGRLGGFNE
jgi:hypothetical protein